MCQQDGNWWPPGPIEADQECENLQEEVLKIRLNFPQEAEDEEAHWVWHRSDKRFIPLSEGYFNWLSRDHSRAFSLEGYQKWLNNELPPDSCRYNLVRQSGVPNINWDSERNGWRLQFRKDSRTTNEVYSVSKHGSEEAALAAAKRRRQHFAELGKVKALTVESSEDGEMLRSTVPGVYWDSKKKMWKAQVTLPKMGSLETKSSSHRRKTACVSPRGVGSWPERVDAARRKAEEIQRRQTLAHGIQSRLKAISVPAMASSRKKRKLEDSV